MVQTSETDLALQNLANKLTLLLKQLHSGILNTLNDMAERPIPVMAL